MVRIFLILGYWQNIPIAVANLATTIFSDFSDEKKKENWWSEAA